MTTLAPLKALVVEDIFKNGKYLGKIANTIHEISVEGILSDPHIALSFLAQTPVDLILLYSEETNLEELEVLSKIHQRYPDIGVIVLNGNREKQGTSPKNAAEYGILGYVSRSTSCSEEEHEMAEVRYRLVTIIDDFRNTRIARIPQKAEISTGNGYPTSLSRFDIIVIGVSTGGPHALSEVIPKLPGDLGIPILIVQHMPSDFTGSFARNLDLKSGLSVKEAEDKELLEANTVYIAPGGRHMTVNRESGSNNQVRILLTNDPPENSCRPSADVLFRSVSATYGKNILVVMMTGMGRDGALGVQTIKTNGGYCLSQSERSCVVYGMPKAVDELQLSDEQIDLEDFPQRIVSLVKKNGRGD
jgi:two-component system, chemotaxis family, protein-glutamate methylesterase/glutaminase